MSISNEEAAVPKICFRPDKNLRLLQLASPTRFVGEVEVPGHFLLSHSFADDLGKQYSSLTLEKYSPFSRNYYLLGLCVDALNGEAPDTVFRQLIVAASVRAGKRFDDMGIIAINGHYQPAHENLTPFTKFTSAGFWNRFNRKNYPLSPTVTEPLEFGSLEPILKFVTDPGADKKQVRDVFVAAGSFYLNALRYVDSDLEKAYIDLVVAMEILSSKIPFSDDELYGDDPFLQELFSTLDAKKVRTLKNQLKKISKRYRLTVEKLVDSEFFSVSEVCDTKEDLRRAYNLPQGNERPWELFRLKSVDLNKYASITYNMRSKYVHEGAAMRHLVHGLSQFNAEVAGTINEPEQTPTFVGFERLVRYALLRYLLLNGCHI